MSWKVQKKDESYEQNSPNRDEPPEAKAPEAKGGIVPPYMLEKMQQSNIESKMEAFRRKKEAQHKEEKTQYKQVSKEEPKGYSDESIKTMEQVRKERLKKFDPKDEKQ